METFLQMLHDRVREMAQMEIFLQMLNHASEAYLYYKANGVSIETAKLHLDEILVFPEMETVKLTDGANDIEVDFSDLESSEEGWNASGTEHHYIMNFIGGALTLYTKVKGE